jgi:aldehyde:ferredoxin oxidoreductase
MTVQDKPLDIKLDRERYETVLDEFYRISGYDQANGIPTRETFERLGLGDIARDLNLSV